MNNIVEARFWSKVDKNRPVPPHRPELGPCWVWTAGRAHNGYGRFFSGGKTVRTHRFAFVLAIGEIPEGMEVCHRCDNPPCCNPAHLFLGTRADNAADMARKRRGPEGARNGAHTHPDQVRRGSLNGRSRLCVAQVVEIRRLCSEGASQRSLARRFSVSTQLVSLIVRREVWAHVESGDDHG